MIRIVLLIQVFVFLFSGALHAQKKPAKSKTSDDILGDAEYFYEQKNFLRALPLYKQLLDKDPADVVLKYRLGVCYLYKSDEKEQSVKLLEEVNQTNPGIDKINFYLGRAYHLNNRFDDAITVFNKYMSGKLPPQEKYLVNQYISNCQHGKVLYQTPIEIDIRNLGAPINTDNSEYVPVITADETMLIYTYKGVRSTGGLQNLKFKPDPDGEYYEDIMVAQRVGDTWLSPEAISNKINTNGHDACIALSNDGQMLFLYRSTSKDKGDIYMSTLNGNDWTDPVKLDENINTNAWEGSCSLSNDGKTLYFASERAGGFGGRDIYVSQRQPDGKWGKATNLGPTINTPYNDDAPFIHPDAITLFFSSEGHNSMGGYDLFYTINKEESWEKPINFGYPVNTTFDERFYVLTADGATGYYSSDRKGTVGQQDIYAVSPGFQGEPPVLALVVGFITVNQKPTDAKITVTNDETGEQQGVYHANSSTGKYLIALKPGNKYKVAIEVEGIDPYYEYVNVKGIDTYVQVQKDYNFESQDGGKPRSVVSDSSEVLQNKIDVQLKKIREEQKTDVYERKIYKNVLKKYGEVTSDSTSFNLEFGRYENPADFDSTKLAGMGPFRKSKDPEGNTIYSSGPFKNILESEIFRAKVYARDSALALNAEVTVNNKGERKMVQEQFRKEYSRKGYEPPKNTRVIKSKKGTLYSTTTENFDYDKLLQDKGTFEADGLSYKLELASVEKEGDFDPALFEKYGKVEKKKYPDGTLRYSMGPFKTLKEAEDFKRSLVEKEPVASKSIVTVFLFGQRKTLPEYFTGTQPCDNKPVDLNWFMDKSLNNAEVYAKFLQLSGNYCKEGLIYKVQIGAYRKPQNFKYPQLKSYGPAEITPYPDGITRFTLRQFANIKEAEAFRQEMISKGIKDAWITAVYQGERKTLEDLIKANFYGAAIN